MSNLTDNSDRLPGAVPAVRGCGRCFDIVCALAGLLLLGPALLLIALLVLLFDGGPVLFRQERMGRRGKPFQLWKFRTMRTQRPGSKGPLITAAGDPRITKLGCWLRRLKLDELPQLYNVLLGQMSVIGPRPEVKGYVHFEEPSWQVVLSVRPGLTDLATLVYVDEEQTLAVCEDPEVHYRETILPRKLALNVHYLRLRTRPTDLLLVLLTILYVLRLGRRGQNWIHKFPPMEQLT
jgi:lipopolysaccharide/colanic/teichoic acid biosynthesis glycosyltransferase